MSILTYINKYMTILQENRKIYKPKELIIYQDYPHQIPNILIIY